MTLFDIYEGDQVPEGYRSLAFALRLRAADHTLTAKESEAVRAQVVAKAKKVLGASVRARDVATSVWPVESHVWRPTHWGVAGADSTGLRLSMVLCTFL